MQVYIPRGWILAARVELSDAAEVIQNIRAERCIHGNSTGEPRVHFLLNQRSVKVPRVNHYEPGSCHELTSLDVHA